MRCCCLVFKWSEVTEFYVYCRSLSQSRVVECCQVKVCGLPDKEDVRSVLFW